MFIEFFLFYTTVPFQIGLEVNVLPDVIDAMAKLNPSFLIGGLV